nr:Glucokinase [Chlamydiota bacterium]
MVCLAGDIGGTKSHLALFERGSERKWLADAKFRSSDYSNLIDIVQEFVSENHASIEAACFGVAGPVQDNVCRATNLPWVVDGNEIGKQMGIAKVSLINDLEANGWGIPALTEDEFFVLNEGKEHVGNRALISAGTGLGEAGSYWDGGRYH